MTSLFHPILSIPTTISRIVNPSLNLISRYKESFTDGSQTRAFRKLRTEIERGGAVEMLGKVGEHWDKKIRFQQELLEKQQQAEREGVKKVGKEVEGKGE